MSAETVEEGEIIIPLEKFNNCRISTILEDMAWFFDHAVNPKCIFERTSMSRNEGGESIEQAVANLQRDVMAMRQILTLLLAHHAIHSPMPNTLAGLKSLLDEVYSGGAVEEQVRDKIDEIIGAANTLLSSVKGSSR